MSSDAMGRPISIERRRFEPGVTAVLAHGGVDMEPLDATFAVLEAAAARGLGAVEDGAGGVDAAVAAVAVLEDDPAFNAGLGSVLTRDGGVETDGAVSDGFAGRSAGVGAVPGLRNPAAVARLLLDEENVVLLVGEPAAAFARSNGIETEDLVTLEQRAALAALAAGLSSPFTGRAAPSETVGCLVVGADGRVSSASSTGGLVGKPSGRVGDSCVPGAGFWTDRRFGVLCSGSGEAAMRGHLARSVAMQAEEHGLLDAATAAIARIGETGAVCAIIAADAATGDVVTVHNGASFPAVLVIPGRTERLGASGGARA